MSTNRTLSAQEISPHTSILTELYGFTIFVAKSLRLNKISFIRNFYYKLINSFFSLPNKENILIEFFGMKMYSYNPSTTSSGRILYRKGIFEPKVTRFLLKVVGRGMTVLDVGADLGYYTLLCANSVGEEGEVIAFEPIPWARERLLMNIELNGFKNIRVYDFALNDVSGEAVMPEPGKDSRIVLNNEDGVPTSNSLRVKLEKYDDYFKNQQRKIDLIKIDTEGAELNILLGMQNMIQKDSPSILVEIHNHKIKHFDHEVLDVFKFFDRMHYRYKYIDREFDARHVYFYKG